MNFPTRSFAGLAGALLLAGCVSVPSGPSVMALPGTGKSFEQFRADDAECRQYAQSQSGGAEQAGVDAGLRSAAVGTVVGAVAGAAIGGHNAAGVGAGTGLIVGSMAGTGAAKSSARGTQRQYDNAYTQCMYAKGEQVPLPGLSERRRSRPADRYDAEPAGSAYPPPPPPGYAPPPPPPGAPAR